MRIGGLYALARVATGSPIDVLTIGVVKAFVAACDRPGVPTGGAVPS
ncbi:hypothetical protein AB0K48_13530 [Nonomuraea sp. NPDC055795]